MINFKRNAKRVEDMQAKIKYYEDVVNNWEKVHIDLIQQYDKQASELTGQKVAASTLLLMLKQLHNQGSDLRALLKDFNSTNGAIFKWDDTSANYTRVINFIEGTPIEDE